MSGIIFDIETVGENFDSLDEASREYFLKFAQTEEERAEARNSLSFYPLTAQIVAIGMLEAEGAKGFVFFQNGSGQPQSFKEGDVQYVSGTEKEILQHFWTQIKPYERFVTFNGRVFDCPFLMLRSAIHKVRPSKNLVPYRYSYTNHIDLYDQLTFYDALRRRFGLHLWCRAFGIKSPKEEGISGLDVKGLYEAGRYLDIARYCGRDIVATKELFLYWDKYLKF